MARSKAKVIQLVHICNIVLKYQIYFLANYLNPEKCSRRNDCQKLIQAEKKSY